MIFYVNQGFACFFYRGKPYASDIMIPLKTSSSILRPQIPLKTVDENGEVESLIVKGNNVTGKNNIFKLVRLTFLDSEKQRLRYEKTRKKFSEFGRCDM